MGKPLIRRQYAPLNPHEFSNPIESHTLVTAVEEFCKSVFHDQVEILTMKGCIFLLLSGRILALGEEAPLHIYAICNRPVHERAVRKALEQIHASFLLEHPKLKSSMSTDTFEDFGHQIDEILGDLVLRPRDRLERLL
jgi:hypothetical protein